MSLDLSEHKRRVAAVYNLAAPGYDKPAVRFFRLCAERLVEVAGVLHAQRVLDIATGTGVAALAAARAVGPTGQVVGVDIAADMLAQAQRKVDEAHLTNEDLARFKAEHLAEVAQLATEQGIWLDIPAIFAVGRKPAPRG